MKGQLFNKIVLLLVCSFLVASTFAQEDPPTLPNDPDGITDYLPLTLLSFSSALKNGSAQLYWHTSNEVNVNSFTVERSADAVQYKGVGSVPAKNNLANSYDFADNIAIQNVAYYRLKMIDKDGSFQYSTTAVVKNGTISKLSFYPNPAKNVVTVVHGTPSGTASLFITDIIGRKIQTVVVFSDAQQTSFALNSTIKPGMYVLQFIDDRGTQTLQLLKQ
jgi:hypothetical protein